MFLSLALLCSIGTPVDPVHVDRIEINTVYETYNRFDGFHVVVDWKVDFTQIILWRWSERTNEYQVAQWVIVREEGSYDILGDWFFFRGMILRSPTIIHTETTFDRERREKRKLPSSKRKVYFNDWES